jgi:hypothetical protein
MLEIHTSAVNPFFLQMQIDSIRAYVGGDGDYRFVVFNDAKPFGDFTNFGDTGFRRAISDICAKNNVTCIELPSAVHQHIACPSTRTAHALNIMLDYERRLGNPLLLIDSDMFPIAPFDVHKYAGYDLAVVPQERVAADGRVVNYFWNGYAYMNLPVLAPAEKLSWACNDIEGAWTDTGGAMHYFLRESCNTLYTVPVLGSGRWNTVPPHLPSAWRDYFVADPKNTADGNFWSELYDGTFFHFRAGGNWEKEERVLFDVRINNLRDTLYRTLPR